MTVPNKQKANAMKRDLAKKTPKIRYLSRREMLGLMGSTAVAVTLAGCGGSEQSGQSGSGEQTSASTAEPTSGAAAETASTCVVKPEQTEGPYFVDEMLNRSDIREDREGVQLDLVFNVSRVDEGNAAACGPLAGRRAGGHLACRRGGPVLGCSGQR